MWIPLVILAVVCVAAFTVTRIHGLFGSEKRPSYSDGQNDETKPFNPKRLTYEIFGPPGTVADISYFDVNSEPQRVSDATLPWQLEIVTTLPRWWEASWLKAIATASAAASSWTAK